jgi:hypothetical protein
MVCELEARGIKTLTYVNPFLCNIEGKLNGTNLFKHAEQHGFLVKNKKNESYELFLTLPTVKMGTLDVTNRAAAEWSAFHRSDAHLPQVVVRASAHRAFEEAHRRSVRGVHEPNRCALNEHDRCTASAQVLDRSDPEERHRHGPEVPSVRVDGRLWRVRRQRTCIAGAGAGAIAALCVLFPSPSAPVQRCDARQALCCKD